MCAPAQFVGVHRVFAESCSREKTTTSRNGIHFCVDGVISRVLPAAVWFYFLVWDDHAHWRLWNFEAWLVARQTIHLQRLSMPWNEFLSWFRWNLWCRWFLTEDKKRNYRWMDETKLRKINWRMRTLLCRGENRQVVYTQNRSQPHSLSLSLS